MNTILMLRLESRGGDPRIMMAGNDNEVRPWEDTLAIVRVRASYLLTAKIDVPDHCNTKKRTRAVMSIRCSSFRKYQTEA